ncbi:MAG: ABC transporter permease [Planctomycetota bacterium]|jgi:ABC-type transport system involved in multi-copper enzyme maturation permease subunit
MENPLLAREFITSLRTRKAVAFGIVYLLAMSALVMLMWPKGGAYSLAARSSHELFTMLAMGQLIFVVLIAPAFTAVSITSEKENETYELLYHTMLSPLQIIFGKLAAGLGFSFIILLASLPMMGACYILGGISILDVAMVYAVLISSIIFFGLLGMSFSCSAKSSYNAIIISYLAIVLISGITWVPSIILGTWAREFAAIHMVRAVSPFAAMLSIVNPDYFRSEHTGELLPIVKMADSYIPFVIFSAAGSLVLVVKIIIAVSRPPDPRKRKDQEVIDEKMELLKRKVKFPFYLFDPQRRKKMIGPILNIIAVKEMRTKAFGRVSWVMRAMYFSVIISLLLSFLPLYQIVKGAVEVSTIILVCISLPFGLILLVSPVLTSSSISSEIESGVFEALRMTKVSAFSVVIGKLEVAWFFILLLASSTFPTFLMLAYLSSPIGEMEKISNAVKALRLEGVSAFYDTIITVNVEVLTGILHAFAVALTGILFTTVVGIFCSSFFKKSSVATSVSYGVVLALGFGTMIPYFLSGNIPVSIVEFFLTLNPFAAAGKAASKDVFVYFSSDLWINHIKYVGGFSLALLFLSVCKVWFMMKPGKK